MSFCFLKKPLVQNQVQNKISDLELFLWCVWLSIRLHLHVTFFFQTNHYMESNIQVFKSNISNLVFPCFGSNLVRKYEAP